MMVVGGWTATIAKPFMETGEDCPAVYVSPKAVSSLVFPLLDISQLLLNHNPRGPIS
jgi:hypothetical protein